MSQTTLGTIETMLESVIEETDDPEIRFKLRQALQLLTFVEDQHIEVRTVLKDSDLDGETRENLQELGYLD